MDESRIRRKMQAALREPSAPAALVERTTQAARAIRFGQEAREQLTKQGNGIGKEQAAMLTAQILVGKMSAKRIPAAGMTAERMVSQLMQDSVFRKETERPPEALLKSIDDGSFVKQLAQKHTAEKQRGAVAPKPKKNLPPPTR